VTSPVDLAEQLAQLEGSAGQDPDDQPPEPVYATLGDWVTDWLGQVVERRVRTEDVSTKGYLARWCPSWWDHPEAVSRLGALWRAWESLRLDPSVGMSTWWRDHWDPHWGDLTSEYGPFSTCTEEGKHIGPAAPLPLTPPPAEWIPPVD
jgi:hypothetical protein